MSSRDRIVDTIRRGLRRGPLEGDRLEAVRSRVDAHPRGPVPARGAALDHRGQVELFVTMAEEAAASVARVADGDAVAGAVGDYLAERRYSETGLLVAADGVLDALDWSAAGLQAESGRAARNDDRVCVSPAYAGVAETGTLVLVSGPRSPTTMNFLPDHHIVVLAADCIVGAYEDIWDRLRGEGALPRTVNFITGPSRSADIEQTLQMGAHGPVSLHIVLLGGSGTAE